MIDHRAFAEPLLQPIITGKVRLNMRECRTAFVPEQKFQLPKLDRLESRCRLESVTETRKGRWRHCFENVHLAHQCLHDGPGAFEGMNRTEEIACGKILLNFFKLMQQLLKPELIGLMNDDEQHFIVFRWR